MAEQQLQERTEQATPKRRQEARKKGQVARSRELNMAAVMIGAALVTLLSGPVIADALMNMMRRGLSLSPQQIFDTNSLSNMLAIATFESLLSLAPLLITLIIAAIAGGMALGGWVFSIENLQPKLSKLNPLKGLKRVFGLKGLVEVAKALGKAGVVGAAAFVFLYLSAGDIINLSITPFRSGIATVSGLLNGVFLIACFSLLIIAMFDVPFQIWNHNKELRMTRKEVQDELKETEGRPEVKSKVRAMQQEIANRRMLRDVPDADVIITNPEHFAVALKYEEGNMNAPVVLAKGMDHMAARIREIAALHDVVTYEAPTLARAIYWTTDVGQTIPAKLYMAVAQVLTYVLRLKAYNSGTADYPEKPVVELDDELSSEYAGRTVRARETE